MMVTLKSILMTDFNVNFISKLNVEPQTDANVFVKCELLLLRVWGLCILVVGNVKSYRCVEKHFPTE